MPKTTHRKNPPDATVRNVRAANKRLRAHHLQLVDLERRVKHLERFLGRVGRGGS